MSARRRRLLCGQGPGTQPRQFYRAGPTPPAQHREMDWVARSLRAVEENRFSLYLPADRPADRATAASAAFRTPVAADSDEDGTRDPAGGIHPRRGAL